MPKNLTGGNKAKKGANKEGAKSVKNRKLVEDLLDDISKGEINILSRDERIVVAKVDKKLGQGRFSVWLGGDRLVQATIPGRMGKGGRGGAVWIDVGNLVRVDLGDPSVKMDAMIECVFSAKHIARLKNLLPAMDSRFFTGTIGSSSDDEGGIEFDRTEGEEAPAEDADAEVNVDAI
jgi:translation initiation factor IF-1